MENNFKIANYFWILALFILSINLVSGYPAGGYSSVCTETDSCVNQFLPGGIGGETGIPFGPILNISSDSLNISDNLESISIKIDDTWYPVTDRGYITIPGQAEARVLRLDPINRTAIIIFNYFLDHCSNSTTLIEYGCSISGYRQQFICENGCQDGACIPVNEQNLLQNY